MKTGEVLLILTAIAGLICSAVSFGGADMLLGRVVAVLVSASVGLMWAAGRLKKAG